MKEIIRYNKLIQKKYRTIYFYVTRGRNTEEVLRMLKLVTKRCKGCGICVNFCPKKVLEVTEIEKVAIIKDRDKNASAADSVRCVARITRFLEKSKGVRVCPEDYCCKATRQ